MANMPLEHLGSVRVTLVQTPYVEMVPTSS